MGARPSAAGPAPHVARRRGREALDRLSAPGRALLECRHAVMGGAMTWVSERNLVAAISNAGGFGVIACGAMEPDRLREEIEATRALTDRPFGVNLIIMHPRLGALIDVCLDRNVGHVVLAGGVPGRATMERVRAGGAKLLCFAPSLGIARKLVRDGADGLIIEGMEAGGHIGPVATGVLAQEILPHLREVPVFVAGGIGHGEAIAAYLRMGAAGVQIGTRFVCAEESIAHPAFKAAFIRASARDAVPSVQVDPEFRVIPVRALANRATARFVQTQRDVIARFRRGELTYEEASLAIEHFWAGALRRAVIDGDVEHGSLMAGQSVGLVTRIEPTAAIIGELLAQAAVSLERELGAPAPAAAAPAPAAG
ncbi:MAG TPA: nitronate monooxygenase, partial [Geminicoccaceae bacterium]|nr:nitronate monooxygenase [Geminicoccaceae bacterium]